MLKNLCRTIKKDEVARFINNLQDLDKFVEKKNKKKIVLVIF